MIQNFNGTKILTTQLIDEQNFGELAASFIEYNERKISREKFGQNAISYTRNSSN